MPLVYYILKSTYLSSLAGNLPNMTCHFLIRKVYIRPASWEHCVVRSTNVLLDQLWMT
jgi:hypothetical protein